MAATPSCRDRGRMMWMGGGLVPVLRASAIPSASLNPNEADGNEDGHKAPASAPPFPLSLQDEEGSFSPLV